MRFQKEDETVTFYKGPPQGPIGATLGTAMNNFYSSPNMVSTHYITWPFSFWIWRRRCLKFAWFWPFGALPLGPHGGHTYYLNNFESPTPKDDFCQVWLKSNHAFSRRRWKCKKFTDGARRTKTDGNSSTWAFGSGELKSCGVSSLMCWYLNIVILSTIVDYRVKSDTTCQQRIVTITALMNGVDYLVSLIQK